MSAKINDTSIPAGSQQPNDYKFQIDQEVMVIARGVYNGRRGFVRCVDEFGDYGVDIFNGEDYDALGFHWSELKAVWS